MTDVAHRTANGGLDQFIPVRKSDIQSALLEHGAFNSDADRAKFRRLCGMLAAIYHYDYFQTLERLRNDYYYFSPEVAPHAALDRAARERCYGDLVQSLEQVLKEANFTELPHAEIGDAHRRRVGHRVEVEAPLHDFRDVRLWRRGRHTEQFEVVVTAIARRAVEHGMRRDVGAEIIIVVAQPLERLEIFIVIDGRQHVAEPAKLLALLVVCAGVLFDQSGQDVAFADRNELIETVVRRAMGNVGHGGAYMVRASAVKALREAGSR